MKGRILWAPCAIALALMAPASARSATVTLGAPDPSLAGEPIAECSFVDQCEAKTIVPTALGPGAGTLLSPADGRIVSWKVRGAPPAYLRLRVVRREPDGSFKGLDTSGAAKASDGIYETPANVAIGAGEQIGLDVFSQFAVSNATVLHGAPALSATWALFDPGLADHATASPTSLTSGAVPLFSATVELFRPQVLQVSPDSAPAHAPTPLYITGRHLTRVTGVRIGGVEAPVLDQIPEQVLVMAPPRPPGRVNVVIETAGGANLDSTADDFTYLGPPPPPDTARPTISKLRISPKAFLTAAGPSASASLALGAAVSYRLSESAVVTFKVLRRKGGKRKVGLGSFELRGRAGKNRFRFSGRVGRAALRAGSYLLRARATDLAGNRSKATQRTFSIITATGALTRSR